MHLWELACKQLRNQVSADEFSVWLVPLDSQGGNEKENQTISDLQLISENAYANQWVKQHYGKQIETAVSEVCEQHGWQCPRILFRSRTANNALSHKVEENKPPKRRLRNTKVVPANKELTFDNFITGNSNRMAKMVAQVVGSEDFSNNLFVFCGRSGLGKTHLLHAIVNNVSHSQEHRVLFVNAESFVMDLSEHIVGKKMDEFKQFYRSADILVMDDIHFLAQKQKSLEEFFHTIRALGEQHKVMVFSCDRLPQHLEGFTAALQTRLAQGLVTGIDKPDMNTRKNILQAKARSNRCVLDDQCALYIAERVKRSVRDLEGALKIVLFYAQAQRCPVDISLIQQALKNIAQPNIAPVTVAEVQSKVADHYAIPLAQLKATGRSRAALLPRQMAIYLARHLTKASLTEIGAAFGGRTHTTVIHSCNTFEGIMKQDSHIKYTFRSIQNKLINQE